jgi:hypothetical protein
MDWREVDNELSGAFRLRKALGAEHNLPHNRRIGHAYENDGGGCGDAMRMAG